VKLKQSTWIILVIGIIIIGAIWAGMILSQQAQQRRELEKNLVLVQQRIAQLKIDDLTRQKDQLILDKEVYTTQIIDTKAKLSSPFDSIAATGAIIESAHAHNLTILRLTSSGNDLGTMAGNIFTILPLDYQVAGSLTNMASFVSDIKTLFPTSVVQLYEFKIGVSNESVENPAETPEIIVTPTPEPSVPTDADNTEATIKIIIYNYKG
jgi:hypothetical protein